MKHASITLLILCALVFGCYWAARVLKAITRAISRAIEDEADKVPDRGGPRVIMRKFAVLTRHILIAFGGTFVWVFGGAITFVVILLAYQGALPTEDFGARDLWLFLGLLAALFGCAIGLPFGVALVALLVRLPVILYAAWRNQGAGDNRKP